ncbi:hypothetical protein QMZ05_24625 [Bradyrhizobium sp. INPA03-11B]|uniref:hypothetical protein n=1 Tax=Bradyrhizobium sp. INPA03-11B TaxID=418598 RepID=UPI00338ED485
MNFSSKPMIDFAMMMLFLEGMCDNPYVPLNAQTTEDNPYRLPGAPPPEVLSIAGMIEAIRICHGNAAAASIKITVN